MKDKKFQKKISSGEFSIENDEGDFFQKKYSDDENSQRGREKKVEKRKRERNNVGNKRGEKKKHKAEPISGMRCYKCNGSGHFLDECTSIFRDESIDCFKCSGKGHMALNCPTLKKDVCHFCKQRGHHFPECQIARNIQGKLKKLISSSTVLKLSSLPLRINLDASNNDPVSTSQVEQVKAEILASPNLLTQAASIMGLQLPSPPPQSDSKACFKCGNSGHISRDCTQVSKARQKGNMLCYVCGEEGHYARECTKFEDTSSKDVCYKCGKAGHMARDCTGKDIRSCYECQQQGHISTQCPLKTQR